MVDLVPVRLPSYLIPVVATADSAKSFEKFKR